MVKLMKRGTGGEWGGRGLTLCFLSQHKVFQSLTHQITLKPINLVFPHGWGGRGYGNFPQGTATDSDDKVIKV